MFPELEEQIVKLMGWEELPGTVDQVKSFCCEECFRRVKVGRLKNETNFLPIWRCVICSIQHEDPSFPKVNRDATIEYINYLDEYLNTTKANQPRILKQAFRLTSRAVTNVSGVYDGEFALFLISHLQVCEVNDVSKFWEMMETDIGGEDGWYKGLEDGIKRHLKNHKKYTLLCNLARRQANPAKHAQGLQGLGLKCKLERTFPVKSNDREPKRQKRDHAYLDKYATALDKSNKLPQDIRNVARVLLDKYGQVNWSAEQMLKKEGLL